MRKCPYCNNEIKGSKHIYYCAKTHNILKNSIDIKYDYVSYNFPEISKKHIINQLYVNEQYSLPMIKNKYNIDFKSILYLLDYFKIKKRTISESAIKISQKKYKNTCQKKYGVNNVSQIDDVKKRKKITTLKNYGVDNIWKHTDYYKIIEKSMMTKYNMSLSELRSIRSKRAWKNKSIIDKKKWINDSIHSFKGVKRAAGYMSSKLENRIIFILNEISIPFETQFYIKDVKAKHKLYDIRIKNTNIIIEVNGDYWHANPDIYVKSDIIKYPFGEKYAFEIWNKDKKKRLLAKKHGFIVKYIWEHDIKKINNKNLINLIKKIIYENN